MAPFPEVMPRRLSAYARERIVRLWQQGSTPAQIVKKLAEEDIVTTRRTVTRRIFCWTKGAGLVDQRRSGRPSVITKNIAEYMDKMLEKDEELSSTEIHRLIARKFGKKIPTQTIRRYLRQKLQWVVVRTKTGPMISDINKVKRMEFAKQCIAAKDTFDDVIWSDESSVQLVRHTRTVRVKVGKQQQYKPVAKHAVKVHVWAGISKRGATKICIFDQIMNAEVYVSIMEDFLVPFISSKFPDGHRYMQDNDPKHTSRLAQAYLKKQGINWWRTPASSADINPIERVWAEMKQYITRRVKPLNKSELVRGIATFWSRRMSKAKCIKYIDHVHKVLPKVEAKKGCITGE